MVIETAKRWMKGATAGRRGIIRHALRTLVKQGNPEALKLLGFGDSSGLVVSKLRLKRSTIRIGQSLDFSFTLTSKRRRAVQVCIDYRIHHLRANGKLSPKTFKLAKRVLGAGESIRMTKVHPIVRITTRRYYGGEQRVEVVVNGSSRGSAAFTLRNAQ